MEPIPVRWLDHRPRHRLGTTCGIPFARGALAADAADAWHLRRGDGVALPTQCWPLAWWGDGSVKWLAVAAVIGPGDDGLVLAPGAVAPARPLHVARPGIEVLWQVDTGAIAAVVGDRGRCLLHALRRGGRTVAGEVHLAGMRERRGRASVSTREESVGLIEGAELELHGPVLARFRLSGRHRCAESGDRWLPFTVRLSFWAGSDRIDVQHTVIYDGRPDRDHCAGLGLRVHLPLDDGPHNHHARLVAPNGVWCQPGRPLAPRAQGEFMLGGEDRARQLAGQAVAAPASLGLQPDWDEVELVQDHHDRFRVRQRCGPGRGWIDAAGGRRAPGAAAVCDPHGGVLLTLADAWRTAPTALAIDGLAGGRARLTGWWWAPQAGPMDLRGYADRGHAGVYEAVDPDPEVSASAHGIARTSRAALHVLAALTRLARSHAITAEEHAALPPGERERVQSRWLLPGLIAWAACETGDAGLARRAWDILVGEGAAHATRAPAGYTMAAMVTAPQPSSWRDEPVTGTTLRQLTASQWALNLIACLRFAGEQALDPGDDGGGRR